MADDTTQEMNTDMAADKGAIDSAEGRPGEGRVRARRRRKVSYLTTNKIGDVDYKDIVTLRRFINEYGKILPSRQNGNTAKQQRMITRSIKRAREMALLPFVIRELRDEPRAPRAPRPSN